MELPEHVDEVAMNQYAGVQGELLMRWAYYDAAETPFKFYPYMLAGLRLGPDESMLDVGCGDCRELTDQLRRNPEYDYFKGKVTGLDINGEPSDETNRKLVADGLEPIDFVQGSMQDMSQFDTDTFDHTMAAFSLYHAPDPIAALGEIMRVTKPGGKVAFATSGPDNKKKHRQFERAIAERNGVDPPPIFAAKFNSDIALTELTKRFEPGLLQGQISRFVINKANRDEMWPIYEGSISSMRNNFSKIILGRDWNRTIEEVVRKPIWDEIERNGEFEDLIRRFGCVMLNIPPKRHVN
jgi:ubiquinone/menaquinone biosynthesis C-methylase UbiE